MTEALLKEHSTLVGQRFVAALAGQAWDRLAGCFEDAVQMRALTPKGLRTAADRDEAMAWFRKWFGQADQLELLGWSAENFAGRLRISYRLRVHEDRWYRIEQQGYWAVTGDSIQACDLVCSGFRPEPADELAETARKDSHPMTDEPVPNTALPQADDLLEMRSPGGDGNTCALLTPAIRARLRNLQGGQVLEVRVDDPAAAGDVAAWSRLSGNSLLATAEAGGLLRFFIRKKAG